MPDPWRVPRVLLIVFLIANILNLALPNPGDPGVLSRFTNAFHPSAATLNYPIPTTSESTGDTSIGVACGAGVEGAWVQLVAATTANSYYQVLGGRTGSQTASIDIGLGAAAAEVAKISNLLYRQDNTLTDKDHQYPIWLFIPSGSRIVARCFGAGALTISMQLTVFE